MMQSPAHVRTDTTASQESATSPFHTRPLAYEHQPSAGRNSGQFGSNPSRFYDASDEKANISDATLPVTDFGGEKSFERKGARGSIAAQMAASGEIPRKAGLKMYRKDEHQGTLLKGGKARFCGRCCCCCTITTILVIIGVVAAFILWLRPPNIIFYGVQPPSSGNEVGLIQDGFEINVILQIGVTNPNFFAANFEQIKATAFYPIKHTEMGGGIIKNADFKAHTNNTVNFPFTVTYTADLDPDGAILQDIALKCGFTGQAATNLNIDYTIELKFKLAVITISPSISNSLSIACPLSEADIKGLISAGSPLGSVFGGGGKKRALSAGTEQRTLLKT